MSNVIYTNFGNIGQIQPAVITYVNQAVRDATQNSVQQSGSSTVNAIPKYVSDNTIQSTNVLINEFDDLSVGGGVEIGTNGVGSSYFLPLGRQIAGDYSIQFDANGNTNWTPAGGGPTPTFLPDLTVQNLAQGTSALNKNYIFPTSLPNIDGQTYASYSFAFDILAGVYTITEFIRTFQLLFDEQVGRFPNVTFRAILVCDTVAANPRFAWDVSGISPNFVRLQSLNATNGHLILGGLPFDQGFDPGLTAYPLLSVTYLFSFPSNNLLEWTKITPAVGSAILSNDRTSSVVCSDVGIGGSVITSQGNWNFELGNLNNVGSISSTAETLTSTCGQSQLQLASIADGSSATNAAFLSATDGLTKTVFASTNNEALIVRDGGAGPVLRVNVGAETILKNAPDRECIRVYDYGVQIKGEGQPVATGVRCTLNMDGDIFFNREDPVFG